MDWKNILERAAWTFVEGFLFAFAAPTDLLDKNAWTMMLVGAAMAGISALKTFILEVVKKTLENKKG